VALTLQNAPRENGARAEAQQQQQTKTTQQMFDPHQHYLSHSLSDGQAHSIRPRRLARRGHVSGLRRGPPPTGPPRPGCPRDMALPSPTHGYRLHAGAPALHAIVADKVVSDEVIVANRLWAPHRDHIFPIPSIHKEVANNMVPSPFVVIKCRCPPCLVAREKDQPPMMLSGHIARIPKDFFPIPQSQAASFSNKGEDILSASASLNQSTASGHDSATACATRCSCCGRLTSLRSLASTA